MRVVHLRDKNSLKLPIKLYQIVSRCSSTSPTWQQPSGYETPLKIYSCVAKTQVPLIVGNKHLVSWYTCGPTVYDDAHIGHASCYMRLDILQRILRRHFALNIVSTMNITDIDDKIIARSRSDKVPVAEVSRAFEKSFWADMDALGITRPDKVLRVTENMPLIIDFISKLLCANVAYKGGDGSIYFDVRQYEALKAGNKYGKLQNLAREEQENAGSNKIKRHSEDFALWKAAKEGEPKWEADFGPGRPGWHIECSSLASSFYGKTIDIHAGGVDLRFPHHENEEAQSCAYHGHSQWVNYWLHVGHLHLPNAPKMSKSLKNTVSIHDLLETCDPAVFRMSCLLTNYKNDMIYSPEHIKLAETHVKSLKNFLTDVTTLIRKDAVSITVNADVLLAALAHTVDAVDSALHKDFDTPGVIKALESLISQCNKVVHAAGGAHSVNHSSVASLLAVVNYVHEVCESFGLSFAQDGGVATDEGEFAQVMDVLVNFRHQLRGLSLVRKDKEGLALCDDIREECKKLGVVLKDGAKISTWNK